MKLQQNKKAEMGIGTLIIFIALLLVAAVAAGVLIQTSGSLQERALTTGDQAKAQIATNVRVIEVSGTDGSNGDLEEIEEIVKLSPGSNPIKLSQTLITLNTFDATAVLQYRGTNGTYENNISQGYYTIAKNETLPLVSNASSVILAEDYDLDGTQDTVILTSSGFLNFTFSSDNSNLVVSDFNCSSPTGNNIAGTYAISGNDYVSSIIATGTCGLNGATLLNTSGATISVVPKQSGEGFFSVEYLQRGNNPVDGNLQTGDVIKIYIESPRSIDEDEDIRLNFIPKIGTPTLTQFITPEVISNQRVYLYP